jgi:hypothetical protein
MYLLLILVAAVGCWLLAKAIDALFPNLPRPAHGSSAWTDTESLGEKTSLTGGPWVITFIRQSGNVHRIDGAETAAEAIAKVQAAFRRAKIHGIRVSGSTPDGFSAYRAVHHARGSSEGKKLGAVKVSRRRVA